MLSRIKQFIAALTAKLTAEDRRQIATLLNDNERTLFYDMDIIDQRHSLDVLRSCLEFMELETRPLNRNLLLKAALLHDVGKRAGDLSLLDRILVVLMRKYAPFWFYRLAKAKGSPFYVSLNHPVIGKALCAQAGCSDELTLLIGLHQIGGPQVELEILHAADRQN